MVEIVIPLDGVVDNEAEKIDDETNSRAKHRNRFRNNFLMKLRNAYSM